MQILRSIAEARQACREASRTGTLGLVPTMGALHEGHLSLVRAARRQCESVAVSIFVNPTQFAPHEDFSRYPRTFAADCALLEREGVDLLFAPSAEEMYPAEMYPPASARTFVEVPGISERLDGTFRSGHLRAVATVVAKLFHIVGPQFAFFGQKDAAQVVTLQAMVRDLNFPLQLVVCPTVRDPEGIALSSRNRFLTPEQRSQAIALPKALAAVATAVNRGEFAAQPLRRLLEASLQSCPGLRLEYAEIVSPDTLEQVSDLARGALVAVAAWAGDTRLIDNIVIPPIPQAVHAEAEIPQEVSA